MINEMPGQGSSVGVSTFYPDDCDSVSGEELGDVAVAVAGGGKGIGGEVFTSLGHDGHGVGIGVGIDAGYGASNVDGWCGHDVHGLSEVVGYGDPHIRSFRQTRR